MQKKLFIGAGLLAALLIAIMAVKFNLERQAMSVVVSEEKTRDSSDVFAPIEDTLAPDVNSKSPCPESNLPRAEIEPSSPWEKVGC